VLGAIESPDGIIAVILGSLKRVFGVVILVLGLGEVLLGLDQLALSAAEAISVLVGLVAANRIVACTFLLTAAGVVTRSGRRLT
jgi:hypothetical protein